MHVAAPAPEYCPLPQLEQAEGAVRPGCKLNLPPGQSVHVVLPAEEPYLPARQSVHAAELLTLENVPAQQALHAIAPAEDEHTVAVADELAQLPASHCWQLDRPVPALYSPAGHSVHMVAFSTPENLPNPQTLHAVRPAKSAYLPGSHFVQSSGLSWLLAMKGLWTSLPIFPAAHLWHPLRSPCSANLPDSQFVHALAPFAELLPAAQSWHTPAAAAEYWPTAQSWHPKGSPARANLPAEHAVQGPPTALLVPAAQSVQDAAVAPLPMFTVTATPLSGGFQSTVGADA